MSRIPDIIDLRQNAYGTAAIDVVPLLLECAHGLQQPVGLKRLPTILLYDEKGLQLFDQITYVPEYYPTLTEAKILSERASELVDTLPSGAIVVELGAGSLRKTKIILDAFEAACKRVDYYALDLSEPELRRSLANLAHYSYVNVAGLWGEYEDGMEYIRQLQGRESPLVVLWLGSSIGNLEREASFGFLRKLGSYLQPGDQVVIGMDKRKDKSTIELAYNDPQGVTRQFILNGLEHVNRLLGYSAFPLDQFAYTEWYDESVGRHEAYIESVCDQIITFTVNDATYAIELKANELIFVECSYKYSNEEISETAKQASLVHTAQWEDAQHRYSLNVLEKPNFSFDLSRGLSGLPTLDEWRQLWLAWDTITDGMVKDDAMSMQPIKLRNPLVFYYGHVPAFLDIQLSRALNEPYTQPESFASMFERGLDPDVDDPTQCHWHSELPEVWPSLEEIRSYKGAVRSRLTALYRSSQTMPANVQRAIWMSFEHEAMHIETFLYACVQQPEVFSRTPTRLRLSRDQSSHSIMNARFVAVPGGEVRLGHNDSERFAHPVEMGWDCEAPETKVAVEAFEIQERPVTVGEYYLFIQQESIAPPHSWVESQLSEFGHAVRTVYGPVPLEEAWLWPVSVTVDEASHYAKTNGYRLPSEAEVRLAMAKHVTASSRTSNTGVMQWTPGDVSVGPTAGVEFFNGGWEITGTCFAPFEGYERSSLYPGYAGDFFDGKHYVVLGGSWATHPRLLRPSFRNWYHVRYPYAFTQFRCVRPATQAVVNSAMVA